MHLPRHCASWPPLAVHRVECRHQPEIEVWPACAELYFLDERHVDIASTQVRFDAVVYNTPSRAVLWEVQDASGGPGAGVIDMTGLYTAPKKNGLPSGTTEIVVATAADDPLRKAFARITLIGRGPEPKPEPWVEIVPKHASLYFTDNEAGKYVDWSKKCQLFRVGFHHTPEAALRWTIRRHADTETYVTSNPWFLYDAPNWPGPGVFTDNLSVSAALQDDANVFDTATVLLVKYVWPPLS